MYVVSWKNVDMNITNKIFSDVKYLFPTKISNLVLQYPFVGTAVLLSYSMV